MLLLLPLQTFSHRKPLQPLPPRTFSHRHPLLPLLLTRFRKTRQANLQQAFFRSPRPRPVSRRSLSQRHHR
ncbi:hypothetical protein ATCV1_z404L [Acanthocystis turfacea chlorella virus 1]|uniref:Uncharacterized protein z404L n=1 Tax=Chlorovirus heliozoae TaxID=322019 RepID=A7K914_9PHYC|nr:hypothetical protein ATCV1_z404L [Acanthocystis turfacea chlorella virus 1]ABT16538.1 hypothetical protein ATCV1_z404L [Acanthocystis turfacea chlorella virus 1]